MKTLLIMRHAKSSWAESGRRDYDRPLNDRGKRDAPTMGKLLAQHDLVPDRIISSSARRARKTAAKVAAAAGFTGDVELEDSLYLAPPATYLNFAFGLPDACQRVLMIGHNPGVEELVEQLAGHYESMPTSATACFALDISTWTEAALTTRAQLVYLWRCER